jgi:hypothetical protein
MVGINRFDPSAFAFEQRRARAVQLLAKLEDLGL